MTRQKPKYTQASSASHDLDQTEPVQDLEVTDAEAADAVKGGSIVTQSGLEALGAQIGMVSGQSSGGGGAGKIWGTTL